MGAARARRLAGWGGAALAAVALALAFRLPRLDARPMHGDEANQAVRAGILLDQGVYHYDPEDHHGPVLYYAAWPLCRATARSFAETTEWSYRLVPVVFSCLTLLLMLGLGRRVGEGLFANAEGLAAAVLLTAVSPALAYYGRFFIQESMLVAFLTGMLVCAVRYVRARSPAADGSRGRSPSSPDRGASSTCPERPLDLVPGVGWAAGFGVFAGLAAATKETVVLSFAAAAVAAVAACGPRRLLRAWRTSHALAALGCAALVAAALYSSFFTYPRGVYDALFSAVRGCAHRAACVPEHQHPWFFYLKLLFGFKYGRGPLWSEAGLLLPVLLAACAAWRPGAAAAPQARWLRFTAVYTVALTALYCAIPYKTPWCALTFLHGYILLAGAGFGALAGALRGLPAARAAAWAAFAALLAWEGRAAHRACFKLPADPRNPYVYAHTGADAMNLVAAVEAAATRAQGRETPIAVAAPTPDTWPLPWYLRKYRQVGYWTRVDDVPTNFAPTVVIAAAAEGDAADARFGRGKRATFYGIRPGTLLNLFVPERPH